MSRLIAWKDSALDHKPLLLYGARQVGKTYILKDFAQKYFDNMVYLNFEQTPEFKSIFDGDLSSSRIVGMIEAFFGVTVSKERTLIFFDEIQSCDRALSALKYFEEQSSGYYLVAAGSLLGVAINRNKQSFPVGKVQIETLYPLDFEEFLWARDKRKLSEMIRESYQHNQEMMALFHEQALELFNQYLLIGGMPAAVIAYFTENNFQQVAKIQADILTAYLADMSKYTSATDAVKVRTAFESIPAQLAKDNKKFQYKLLKKGASASHFGVALDWLSAAGLVNQCVKVNQGLIPLSAYQELSHFKLYFCDVGLLAQQSSITLESLMTLNHRHSTFKGALIENYVAQALRSQGYDLHYWESDSTAEVDFVVTINGLPIPIEVKSSAHIRSRSLSVYVQKYVPAYSIRLSTKNFGFENKIKSIPLYAAFII